MLSKCLSTVFNSNVSGLFIVSPPFLKLYICPSAHLANCQGSCVQNPLYLDDTSTKCICKKSHRYHPFSSQASIN